MYKHHEEAVQNLIRYYEGKEGVIALIFDGSVAKGTERPDSDIDATVILTKQQYEKQKAEGRLVEVITGYCNYEGGYFDVKYKTKEFLRRAAVYGSEPTRASFLKAKVLFSKDPEIEGLLREVNTYPAEQAEEKRRVLWANVSLNQHYFTGCVPKTSRYMTLHIVSEVVYSIYRLILLENEILFPCNRRLEEYVDHCENKPENITALAAVYMDRMDQESCDEFVNAYLNWTAFPVEQDINRILTAYTGAYEEWWMKDAAPFVNEW